VIHPGHPDPASIEVSNVSLLAGRKDAQDGSGACYPTQGARRRSLAAPGGRHEPGCHRHHAAIITELCKELKLPAVAREYAGLCRQALDDDWAYEAYLQELLSMEVIARQQNVAKRRVREARFPDIKTLDTSTGPRSKPSARPRSMRSPAVNSSTTPRT
jgi:hypothetical protein